MTTIAITGHRPEQLGETGWVETALETVYGRLQPELVYQGMAAGADLLSATVAEKMGIPYVACRPWATHSARDQDAELYQHVLDAAERVDVVSDAQSYVGPWLYHKRNEYMVDHADIVVAVWNGSNTGGTAACVRYAKKQNKFIVRINPDTQLITRYHERVEPVAVVEDTTALF